MRTVGLIIPLTLGLLAAPPVADGQPPAKVPRIGFLLPGPIATRAHLWGAFREGLRELGYVEGRNIAFEIRSPDRESERLANLAAELVRLNVDVIVTGAPPAPQAAKNATSTIPIVFAAGIDPVAEGLVASLARPGGNITGLSSIAPEVVGKELELLKETAPKVSRVAVLWNPANVTNAPQLREAEGAARALGVELRSLEARSSTEIDAAFAAMARQRARPPRPAGPGAL